MKTAKELKLELDILKRENKKLKLNEKIFFKENNILKKEAAIKDEIIKDLDTYGYKNKYKEIQKDNNGLKNKNVKLKKETIKLKEENIDLKEENIDLKKKNKILSLKLKKYETKDSSNSSMPSSTNGFKKVKKRIFNLREKSDRKKGGQIGHKGTTMTKDDIDILIASKDVETQIIELGKNKYSKKYIEVYEKDVVIKTKVTIYRYYMDENGKYNIPNKHKNKVVYGNNIKTISALLTHKCNLPMDKVSEFFKYITNNSIKITKSTISNFVRTLSTKTNYLIDKIKNMLLFEPICHTDESPVKVNGKNYQLHNYSNAKYTYQIIKSSKSKDTMEEIGFLNNYSGTLIHDHNKVQYNFGTLHGECNSHILRYLKGIEDIYNRKWPTKFKELFLQILTDKKDLIKKDINKFENKVLDNYSKEYDKLIKEAVAEYDKDPNKYSNDEINLIIRLEEYKENHLLFMYDFDVPFSNNRAEADIRPIKMKQKLGIFRSENGAINYSNIRSLISTLMKNNKNVFDYFKRIYDDEIIDLKEELI